MFEQVRYLWALVADVGTLTPRGARLVEFIVVFVIHLCTFLTESLVELLVAFISTVAVLISTFITAFSTIDGAVILLVAVERVHAISFTCHLTCICIMTCN